ncbi:hypothetical protein [Streptomyces sp. AMCC400023]|uniref:hypothetical protein n=1 Tax=Streptomyces sp. AMCC400023 TaxID=2056258 RepID=UPI001F1B6ECB|nr:hypothetical protein [Streptomyces sp. AMCC400023]
MVSNAFLANVLAVLIARYGMSPVQSAVLLFCMGRQVEGRLKITHIKVARHLGSRARERHPGAGQPGELAHAPAPAPTR